MAAKKIPGEIKNAMKRRVTSVLVAIVLLFVLIFVPSEIVDPVANGLKDWQRLLAKLGVSIPLMVVIPWIIFAQDHLATGKSKASQFFKHHFQSTLAMKKYGQTQADANRLWFDYFNKWEDPKHVHHGNYKATFDRSYALRLIYYLKRLLFLFVVAACASTIMMTVLLPDTRPALPARITIIVVVALVWSWLHLSNTFKKLPSGDYEAAGAYFKYQEICGITCSRFEQDVLSKLPRHSPTSVAQPTIRSPTASPSSLEPPSSEAPPHDGAKA
jgi:hypothetical protein